MLTNQNLILEGVFKYKLYDASGNIKQQSDNLKNFITPTGLSYPSIFKFADCFRFLSLGSGTGANTILGLGTTGLNIPIPEFQYIGSRTSFSDVNTSEYEIPGCGYTESNNKLVLSRSWKVPISSQTFAGNYIFKELMLSPGRPTGITNLCGCLGSDTSNGGVDASAIADYYDSISYSLICNANKAFSRIILTNPITVNVTDFLVVSYDLNINYNSGISHFVNSINNNFSTNWSGYITGSSSVINHGLCLINDKDNTQKSSYRNQINNYFWQYEYGESYVPLWGSPLEPSCLSNNLLAYISTDNVQFLVNQISGGALDITSFYPYNISGFRPSSGLMTFVTQPSITNDNRYFNIRTNLSGPIYPEQTNVFINGSPQSDINYIFHTSSNKTNNILSYFVSDRLRSVLYPFVFTNLTASTNGWKNGGFPVPFVRSMVLNYSDATSVINQTMYPFLDLLFTGKNGESIPPTGSDSSYSNPSQNYFYLGGGGDLTLSFALTWSSPCESGVIGC